jgi:phospholipid-binding lipoprotein MlaA
LRDTAALPVDWKGDIVTSVQHVPTRNTATVLRVIDQRSDLLKAGTMLEEAALDRYSFTRDAYLQRRRSVIYDGNPPDDGGAEISPPQTDLSQLSVPANTEMPTNTATETLNSTGVSPEEKDKP